MNPPLYKYCTMCGEPKLLKEFHCSKKGRFGRQAACKLCLRPRARACVNAKNALDPEPNRQRSRDWRAAHPDRDRSVEREREAERRAILDAYKREQSCIDCGSDEGDLHFDHRSGEEKLFNIGTRMTATMEVLWAEVAKCDVRCASCHRKRHIRDAQPAAV